MKKRILLVNDFSQLPTGYGTYGRHLLSGLQEHYEVAELGCYINQNDPRIDKCDWPVFANKPLDPEALKRYEENPVAEYGDHSFNSVLLKWKPSHVISITDPWAFEFVLRSPLRDYFSHVLMPTVDAFPNMSDWIDYYAQADALLAYSEFGKDSMLAQCNTLNFIDVASPSVSKELKQLPKEERAKIRKLASMPEGYIIGTVMRNQPRKLFADLFQAFAKFLKETGRKDVFLYCHTGFPDLGWNIPELLMEYELTNRVLFTYKCKNCGAMSVRFFSDSVCHCEECGKFTNAISGTGNGLNDLELCYAYNMMDCYVQCAKCLHEDQEIRINRNGKSMWCKIPDVKIGDLAWTHKNRWRKVTHTWVNLEKSKHSKMLELKICGDYETLKVTQDHEMPAFTKNELCNKRSIREQIGNILRNGKSIPEMGRYRADKLCKGDIISYAIDDTISDISEINLENLKININNNFCRWLGLYVADGCSYSNKSNGVVKITSNLNENKCHDLCENIMSDFSDGGVKTYFYKNRNALEKQIFNKKLARYMQDNCSKFENKKFPDWVMNLPAEKQKECLQGLFMGDGHSLERRGMTTSILCTISKPLADQIKQILRRLRISFNVRLVTKKQEKDGYTRKPQYRFEIYGDIKNGEFFSDRHSTQNFYYGNHHYLQIKNIQEVKYDKDVYCVTVDEDHTMLTPAGLVYQCEGFGIPVVEAAISGLPVGAINYSAMASILDNIDGYAIKVESYEKEASTNRLLAKPCQKSLIGYFKDMCSLSKEELYKQGSMIANTCKKHYTWEKAIGAWIKAIENGRPPKKPWDSQPRIFQPSMLYDIRGPKEQADFLIKDVLGRPEMVGGQLWRRLIKDLTYNSRIGSYGTFYFNEMAEKDSLKHSDFSFKDAYNEMLVLNDYYNTWERHRISTL